MLIVIFTLILVFALVYFCTCMCGCIGMCFYIYSCICVCKHLAQFKRLSPLSHEPGGKSGVCGHLAGGTRSGESQPTKSTAASFGLPLAVTSFNRVSRFTEAVGRRLLYILTSLYFDDARITDWASSKGSAQASFSSWNDLLGTPFVEEKRQPMHPSGTNLGVDFDFSIVPESCGIKFWVRERLQSKIEGMLEAAEESGTLPLGVASKLCGVLNFLEQGVYGRIGAGGLAALKDRQQERDTAMATRLQTCFNTVRALLKLKPDADS